METVVVVDIIQPTIQIIIPDTIMDPEQPATLDHLREALFCHQVLLNLY